MQQRNIALCIVLSIITCGIYGIYWMIVLTDNTTFASQKKVYSTSGGVAFLLTLITCGIYGFYWDYQMGKSISQAQQDAGIASSDNSILYIVLRLFGLSIVSYALMQSDLNKMVQNG